MRGEVEDGEGKKCWKGQEKAKACSQEGWKRMDAGCCCLKIARD